MSVPAASSAAPIRSNNRASGPGSGSRVTPRASRMKPAARSGLPPIMAPRVIMQYV